MSRMVSEARFVAFGVGSWQMQLQEEIRSGPAEVVQNTCTAEEVALKRLFFF